MSASMHAGRDNLSFQHVIFLFLCPNEMFTYHLPQFGIVGECKSWIFQGLFKPRWLLNNGKINPDVSFMELLL